MNLYKSRKKGNVIPVTGLSLNRSEVENYIGNTSEVKVIVTPSNASHKNNYQVSIGDVEDADKIGTTFTKSGDTITVHFNGKAGGDEYYFHNGVSYKQITKNIPVVVSLDGFSAIFYITMRPNGSRYYGTYDFFYPIRFIKIKNSTLNNSNVQLIQDMNYWDGGARGNISLNDASSIYRPMIDRYYYNHLSTQLYNQLSTFSKVVHSSMTTSTTYNAKYHLLAFGEIGNTLSASEIQEGNSIINLGNDSYPAIMSDPSIVGQGMLSRQIVKAKDFDGGYWACRMTLDSGSVNSNSHGYAGDVDDNDDGIDYSWAVQPIISLPNNISVKKIGTYNNKDHYEIDFTGTSPTKLSSVPLGSYIYDLSGTRNGDLSVIIDGSGEDQNWISLPSAGQSTKINAQMFSADNKASQDFTVSMSNSNVSAVVNGNEITFTCVNDGHRSIATITNVSNGVTKQYDISLL